MLEEAIGTQMYQEKRGRALKSLEKKDPDLASIEGVRTCFFTMCISRLLCRFECSHMYAPTTCKV